MYMYDVYNQGQAEKLKPTSCNILCVVCSDNGLIVSLVRIFVSLYLYQCNNLLVAYVEFPYPLKKRITKLNIRFCVSRRTFRGNTSNFFSLPFFRGFGFVFSDPICLCWSLRG